MGCFWGVKNGQKLPFSANKKLKTNIYTRDMKVTISKVMIETIVELRTLARNEEMPAFS